MPEGAWDVSMRCLIFRLLARQGAAIHQQVSSVHSKFPVKMFALLKHPECAEAITATPKCVRELQELRTVLALHCWMQPTNISQIEARHASIRRTLVNKSVQVRPHAFADASAAYLFQDVRRCLRSMRSKHKVKFFQQVASFLVAE